MHKTPIALAAVILAVPLAHGTDYPARQVRIIVPYAPGGGADITTRMLARQLGTQWNQPVLVDNVAGAGGNIGFEAAARAQPNGHTMVIGTNAMAVNASLFTNPGYDPVKSFAAVTRTTEEPNILVTRNDLPVSSLGELVTLARAKPGALSYASGGNGTTSHLAGELLKLMAKIDIRHIPYKAPIPAMQDVINGTNDMYFAGQGFAGSSIKAGKMRALAVTGRTRSNLFPAVPTLAESGLADFEATVWLGALMPAGTPQELVARAHEGLLRALNTAEVRGRFEEMGFRVIGDTPAEFAAFVRAEVDKWGRLVRAAGIKPD